MEFQLDSFTELHSRCALNKHTVTDWQFATMILITLPNSFSHVQDAFLTTGDPQDLDPDTVRAKVLEFENRKKEQATGSAAFSFSTTMKSSKGKKATTSLSSTLAATSDKSNVECFYCKKKGHMAKVCRTKKWDKAKEKQAEKKNEKSGSGPAKPNVHSLLNVIASDNESDASPLCCYFGAPENWLVDSGATDHMTPFGSDICQGGPQWSPEIQSMLVWSSCWGATGGAGRSTQRGEQRRVVRARGNKGEVGVTRDQCRVW